MTPDARDVLAFIQRARVRHALLRGVSVLARGLVVLVVIALIGRLITRNPRGMQEEVIIFGIIALVFFPVAGAARAWIKRGAFIRELENGAPESRNIVLTADELLHDTRNQQPATRDLVLEHAATSVRSLDLSRIFPAGRAALQFAGALAFWAAAIGLTAVRDPESAIPLGRPAQANTVGSIQVIVTPPAYTKRSTQRLTNPSRIDAMGGSRIDLTVRGDDVHVETLEGAVQPASDNHYALVANADGFIAIHAGTSERRLIGLTVTPDQSPRVRITAPGKDMFLSDAKRRIPVDIDARDDLGLTNLKLRYTKVSGSGERFTFIEGEVPITIMRSDDRDWTAKGTIDLASLKLEQGDMIVYRGAASDARPNAPLSESDAFIVEITSPLSIAAEGFSLDDEKDKYALSQQMVILKTERLLARAATLPQDSLTYYSQNIAAEQRSVRAEFVFMMGGEVAEEVIAAADLADLNETKEAEGESELAAGRLVNRGKVALVDAIRLMSRANTQLNAVDPKSALPVEKQALVALQQAFSRTRYLLRALTLRERLDLSRRMTGVLTLAARDAQAQANPLADPAIVSLRRSLAAIAALASAPPNRTAASRIAQEVLAVDPSDSTLKRVAERLGQSRFDEAATALATALRARLPREDGATETPELRRLRGALSDAARGPR